jgi:hypothetical protein
VIVKVSQDAVTNAVTVYAPTDEKTCEGEIAAEVLAAPLAGSPKFHNIDNIVADVCTENKEGLLRQESAALIIPVQQSPMEIVRQIVVTGLPGSCKETHTVYTPGPENVCVGKGELLAPVIVIVSFVPLAGSPKFQKK